MASGWDSIVDKELSNDSKSSRASVRDVLSSCVGLSKASDSLSRARAVIASVSHSSVLLLVEAVSSSCEVESRTPLKRRTLVHLLEVANGFLHGSNTFISP